MQPIVNSRLPVDLSIPKDPHPIKKHGILSDTVFLRTLLLALYQLLYKLFKEDDDEAMYKNPCEIRLCDLISVSLILKRGLSIALS